MELTFSCPNCGAIGRVSPLETADQAVCRQCGTARPLHREAICSSRLDACPWCLSEDLYLQKDFPQGVGLFLVMVQIALSTVFWYYEMPIATYAVLLASAGIDWALYYTLADVTVCYRCSCQARGVGSNPEGRLGPFDLAIGERYRQERIRAEQLRERGASAEEAFAALTGGASEQEPA
jgi:hypothetical protein